MQTLASALAAAALLAPLALAQNPRAPHRVDGSSVVFDPAIASAGDLTVLAYSGDNTVYVSRSDGTGVSWTAPVPVDGDTTGARKDLENGYDAVQVVGQSVYVLWVDQRASATGQEDLYFNVSNDGGASFAGETRLNTSSAPGAADVIDWRLAVAGSRVHVLYAEDAPSSANQDLYFTTSANGGASFSTPAYLPRGITAGAFDVDNIDLAAAGSDVWVVWEDNRFGNDAVWLQRSADGGQTWLVTDLQLNTPGGAVDADSECVMAVRGATVAVVWSEEPAGSANEELRAAVSTDGGTTFTASAAIGQYTSATNDVDAPWVTVTANGTVIATWEDDRGGSDLIYATRSTDGGVTWSADATLSSATGGFPRIVDSSGQVQVVTWTGGAFPEDGLAAFSYDNGATWQGEVVLSAGLSGDVDFTEAAFNAAYGNFLGAWLADDLGANHVYAGGARGATIDNLGWGTTGPTLGFALSGFGSDVAAFVAASTGTGPLPLLPLDSRVIGLTPDPLFLATLTSPLFSATLSGGAGATPAVPNIFKNQPPAGITLYYAAFGVSAGGGVASITDTGSFPF